MPVSIRPGQMALTRTSVPASWNAVVCARDTTAALDAEYGVDPAFDRRPATDAVPMMLPPEEGFDAEVLVMAGAAYFAARKTLFKRGKRVVQSRAKAALAFETIYMTYLVTLTSRTFRNSSLVKSGKARCGPTMPALAKKMSRRP